MQVQSLSGRSPGEGNGSPLQYSCLEIPMDRGAWRATVHGVTESRTRRKQLNLWTQSCYRCPLVLVLLECGPPAPPTVDISCFPPHYPLPPWTQLHPRG